ncbi:MAG: uncharacterized protein K0S74_474 [Chlamydiales bacterium]|jgi:uncharacterized protein YyaL (SSP411 family)|nr:uncharacterized protein [Chlamydiales bacterium]
MSLESKPRYTNHLVHETSPYLLQHAHNPVNWYPWGAEALHKAKQENSPILLSIGYSACHWCHVMEKESFENESIAALMNRHFVCIKVDREERPDLDEIYMAATVAFNQGHGGWPMTVFLTPQQKPFFAGTYFPPEDRNGIPGFNKILQHIAQLWQEDRQRLIAQAGRITDHLQELYVSNSGQQGVGLELGLSDVADAVNDWKIEFDKQFGGFGDAPKFPPTHALNLLLYWSQRTDDFEALNIVRSTLDHMAKGGIYDQLGGGFARYSVDEKWLVPHFEKMLYDNALLMQNYCELYQVTKNLYYKCILRETAEFIIREMTSSEGGFYSAIDADSEGEEGKFYVWNYDEITNALYSGEAKIFCEYYGVTKQGNWEGKNILHVTHNVEKLAQKFELTPQELIDLLERCRIRLHRIRKQRTPPATDDKILTSWNGLMIEALAKCGHLLHQSRYLHAAEGAANFILQKLRKPDGRLLRTYRSHKAHLEAYLEDYAYLIKSLIALYEASAKPQYIKEAAHLCTIMIQDFHDQSSKSFYNTAHEHESLYLRPREGNDDALPNPNAIAAEVLAKMSLYFDQSEWKVYAQQAINSYAERIREYPTAFGRSLSLINFLAEPPTLLVLSGIPSSKEYLTLQQILAEHYLPHALVAHYDNTIPEEEQLLSLLKGKKPVNGQATLYICRNYTCLAPLTDLEKIKKELQAINSK